MSGAGLRPAFLAFLLFFSLLAGAGARELSPQEEASLFSLADLGPVDLSPKTVVVEVFLSPDPDLAACHRLLPGVWARVQEFYRRLGVNLEKIEAGSQPGPLAPGARLRVEMLTHKDWLARSFKAFDVQPPFRLRFLQVCRDKCAFAHLPLSVVHVSFKRFQEMEFSAKPGDEPLNRDWLANLLIHELGHLLGLYHAHEFVNDPIPEYLPDGKTPNFMSHQIASRTELGWLDFQKRLVHSYLGRGKVYQQYVQVNFDPLNYLKLVKRCNAYREPGAAPKAPGKKQARKGSTKTYDDDDNEEDD
ncbi:MAG: hypothetical protein AB1424_06520 [Thermodesulfobacteriota bacterium]